MSLQERTTLHLADEADTAAFASGIAADVSPGDVIALTGPLGAGKTTFARFLVEALGYSGPVTSPTFTLIHEYRGGRLPVFHLDFHRLASAADLLGIGWDELLDEPALVLVEWADLFPAAFPPHARWIDFSLPENGASGRHVVTGRKT